ncbi:hydroxylamine reductase [Defluviicoccus vanus]|uniref:Hydroxylamine reductase n=1 Tax=Defluviicoccus vanus TaxID=111831 RepID=A0A7H1N670_9PROT|nr:hydroxylamine reductase [Defluviicoccus vanus]QNT71206.1 hydroxylamine reductase [Defluviicoccus vanus]
MFCYQCEQTFRGTGCTTLGVCGKTDETATLQDLLLHAAKGIAMYAHRARGLDRRDGDVDAFILDALFTTVTNVNFDPERLIGLLHQATEMRDRVRALYVQACVDANQTPEQFDGAAAWVPAADRNDLLAQGRAVGIEARTAALGADIAGLQELLTYGLKGAAAYAAHARVLGRENETVYAFLHEALAALTNPTADATTLLGLNLKCGEVGLTVLELLDAANTGAYGTPTPTPVLMGHRPGKAILVSGHDLKDLEILLQQTAGTGINVYTHGEMLPAHGYPELHKYPHLAGHFGGAWMRQKSEFAAFPGAILMTTNCLQQPQPAYRHRLFTSGVVAWPEIPHITNHDFQPVIDAALAAPGFTEASAETRHLVGFGHGTVLSIADKVIGAVKDGDIKRFVLIGGCDGAEMGRNYYTELAEAMPKDWVILTLGCGKFRVVGLELGEIAGLPRLLDMGQCNDAFSAIRVATALAAAFDCGVNDLPLDLVISWYEQKAVLVLLTLLHLGVRNIRLGPKLPAFVTPPVLKILVDTFAIKPIGSVADDLAAMRTAA